MLDRERSIIEGLSNFLRQEAKLGLPEQDENSHTSQFRWEGIDDLFELKMARSSFKDAITSAFFSTHSYKYVDNPTFKLTLERELRQRAVPTNEIDAALKAVDQIVEDLKNNPGEQDSGWNQHIDAMVDLTTNADNRKPETSEPYTGGGPNPKGSRTPQRLAESAEKPAVLTLSINDIEHVQRQSSGELYLSGGMPRYIMDSLQSKFGNHIKIGSWEVDHGVIAEHITRDMSNTVINIIEESLKYAETTRALRLAAPNLEKMLEQVDITATIKPSRSLVELIENCKNRSESALSKAKRIYLTQ